MIKSCLFEFHSSTIIHDYIETTDFKVRGYKDRDDDKIFYYFKDRNKYKFVINNDLLEVYVDDSIYKFKLNEKTEAIIKSSIYEIIATVETSKLIITDTLIDLEYTLSMQEYKGKYQITLKLC
jgi:hypothetical protein